MMAATASELINFFWHCQVAVKLIDELPDTTVTRAHASRAVRMATLCTAGRNGVEYGSDKAREMQQARRRHWELCELNKEHVIPVRLVHKLVLEELRATRECAQSAACVQSDQYAQGLTPEATALFQKYPRAWQAARIIREWTLLAWITREEHQELGKAGLGDRMPKTWRPGQDKFARYTECKIALNPIGASTHAAMSWA